MYFYIIICYFFFFFLNDPAPPEIYPLPLHDPLPIPTASSEAGGTAPCRILPSFAWTAASSTPAMRQRMARSEEHTSELQSPCNLVCRLLLEKKKKRAQCIRSCNISCRDLATISCTYC